MISDISYSEYECCYSNSDKNDTDDMGGIVFSSHNRNRKRFSCNWELNGGVTGYSLISARFIYSNFLLTLTTRIDINHVHYLNLNFNVTNMSETYAHNNFISYITILFYVITIILL